MSCAGLGLALVWLLSAAPLFLPQASGSESSPVALACLPWLVWATLPRGQCENAALERLAPWLAAPLVVLSLALARARGEEWGTALGCAGGCVLLAALYFAAARRAAGPLYACAWFALIAGAPLLARMQESAGAPRALALVAQVSPLSWWLARLHPPATGAELALPWVALALGAALWLAGRAREGRA
jgi:hypothetical protein